MEAHFYTGTLWKYSWRYYNQECMLKIRGIATGVYIGIYTPKKSAQVNFMG